MNCFQVFGLFCAFVVVINIDSVVSGGKMMGGGGGLVLIQNNKPDPLSKPSDILLWGTDCGHGLIKDSGSKGKSILVLPGPCKKKKIIKKKIEYVPIKEYVPVPMKMDMHGGYASQEQPMYVMPEQTQRSEVMMKPDEETTGAQVRTRVVRKMKKRVKNTTKPE